MTSDNGSSSAILSAVVTGFVATIPSSVLGYVEKAISVFILAIVAEIGRRLVTSLWSKK